MSVRALKWAVREAVVDRRNAEREAAAEAEAARAGAARAGTEPPARASDTEADDEPFRPIPTPLATPEIDTNPERIDGSEEPDYWIQFRAPAAIAHLHDTTIELARKAAGAKEPLDRCMEYILAEFIAGTEPVQPVSREDDWATREPLDPIPPAKRIGSPFDEKQDDRERMCEETARNWRSLADPPEQFILDPDLVDDTDTDDPVALDDRIMLLVRLRQIRHGEMATILGEIHGRRLWKVMGFASFNHYCKENLGISLRQAQQLVSANRRFAKLPLVKKAYYSGRLNWAKTRLLLSICEHDIQEVWIERADVVTVRYLECEVARARRRKEVDPEGWKTDGGPLPLSKLPPHARDSQVRPGAGLWEDAAAETHASAHSTDDGGNDAGTRREADDTDDDPNASAHDQTTADHDAEAESDSNADALVSAHNIELPCMIRFKLSPDAYELWAIANRRILDTVGQQLPPWMRHLILLRHFLQQWDDPKNLKLTKDHKLFARDGYQCTAPGCSARRALNDHHMIPRSQGGSDDMTNKTTLCLSHHLHGLHELRALKCEGEAPGEIKWKTALGSFEGDVRIA